MALGGAGFSLERERAGESPQWLQTFVDVDDAQE
jgi:hypothetical protein